MDKKTAKPSIDPVVKKLTDKVKSLGKFEEQEIDARVTDNFRNSGGLALKKWICGDTAISSEIFFNAVNEDLAAHVSFPITLPLKRAEAEKVAVDVLSLSGTLFPANISLSPVGRLTMTLEVRGKTKESDTFISDLAVRVTDGQKLVNALKTELARGSAYIRPFDSSKDEIWQSQMGKPVKLSPESLQLLQGGNFGDVTPLENAQNGGGALGVIGGGLLGFLVGGFGSLAGGALGGYLGYQGGNAAVNAPPIQKASPPPYYPYGR